MQLTGQQIQHIRSALLDAYPTRESLTMMLREQMDEHLEVIAGGENLRVIVFNLVSWAERTGQVDELIRSAADETPGNPALRELVQWWRDLYPLGIESPLSESANQDTVVQGPESIDVFLSYNRADKFAMAQVREALREDGLSVWTDDGLEPGTPNWQSAISEAIRQSKIFLVLLSPNSKESVWVNNEIIYAQAEKKYILPLLLTGDTTTSVPLCLISTQWLDGRKNLSHTVAQGLVPSLQRYLASTRKPFATSAKDVATEHSTSVYTNRGYRWKSYVLFVTAILLGALGVYLFERFPQAFSLPLGGTQLANLPTAQDREANTIVATDAPTPVYSIQAPTAPAIESDRPAASTTYVEPTSQETYETTAITSSTEATVETPPTATVGNEQAAATIQPLVEVSSTPTPVVPTTEPTSGGLMDLIALLRTAVTSLPTRVTVPTPVAVAIKMEEATPTAIATATALPTDTQTPIPTNTLSATDTPQPAATDTPNVSEVVVENSSGIANLPVGGPRSVNIVSPQNPTRSILVTTFAWEPDIPLEPSQVFELTFWRSFETPDAGRAWTEATTKKQVSVNPDGHDGVYNWGVWLAAFDDDGNYHRIRYLGPAQGYTFEVAAPSNGSNGGSSGDTTTGKR